MPTGLYSWGGDLFVTTRLFDGKATRWTIAKIDPNTHRLAGVAIIPTNANHLTIAPGPRQWAFIEKGPVKGWNDNQDIHSILFVPADRLWRRAQGDPCSN